MPPARLAGVLVAVGMLAPVAPAVETLIAVDALPAHLSGRFVDPVGFAVATTGEAIVLDRRAHTVFLIDRDRTTIRQVLKTGFESGNVLSPGVLSLAPNDIFAVADAPNRYERIQYFSLTGQPLGAFYLDEQRPLAPRLSLGTVVLNGVGSMQFTGRTFLVSRPETGALFSEIDNQGAVLRHVGTLRPTGQEADVDLHLALNVGVPLVDPAGGFYFVFQTGIPLVRKYDADGRLVYERHVEGVELDAVIQTLPTHWPLRDTAAGRLPAVTPVVRTAAVDRQGRLWVSLMVPFTFVYDERGEKVRTVRFESAGGTIAPTSLFFGADDRLYVTPGCFVFTP